MRRHRPRLTYADVMATIAVVLALGGASAFAASQLGKNVVKSRNLAPGAVKTADIAKNAVKRAKIAPDAIDDSRLANASVGTTKLREGAVTTGKLASGAVAEGNLSSGVQGKLNIGQSGIAIPSGGQALAAGATLILGTTNIQVGVTGFVKGAEVAGDSNNYGGGGARCLSNSYLIVTA